MFGMPRVDMGEVTRLTREGRLQDALDLLQGRETDRPAPRPTRPDVAARASADVTDLTPPAGGRGAWTAAPPTVDEVTAAAAPDLSKLNRLRGLGATIRDRLGRIGSTGPAVPVPVPSGARFELRQFAGPQGARSYKLYVPSGYARSCPLVVMLHGCTQNPDDFALGTGMNALAERDGFLVAYPAQTNAANPSKCWNWFRPEDQHRGTGEPAIIAGITRAVAEEFGVDTNRIYVAGLSAGGAAAVALGATYPDLYAAVGVHSGLPYRAANDIGSAMAAMRGGSAPASAGRNDVFVPTIVFHGDADRTVHPANAETIVAALRKSAPSSLRVDQAAPQQARGRTPLVLAASDGTPMIEHWTLEGGGHAWSGGHPGGTFTDPQGPDASAEMVRFFGRHRLTPAPDA